MQKATARAHANIALAKYWGKRDQDLILPFFDSVSVTLDAFFTTTTVSFGEQDSDSLTLDNELFFEGSKEFDQLQKPLAKIREYSGVSGGMRAVSRNDVPTAAGLASSASGLAAFASAASAAAGLALDKQEVSKLARLGSGSASRSLFGGFAQWHAGTANDGEDSFSEQLFAPSYWPEFRILACIVSTEAKKTKSRAGMAQTVATSPQYQGWVEQAPRDVAELKSALEDKDFSKLGEVAENSFAQLHATMLSTRPPILYMQPPSLAVIKEVWRAREAGEFEAYVTMDAGPQVKLFCLAPEADAIAERMKAVDGVQDVVVSGVGPDCAALDEHLF